MHRENAAPYMRGVAGKWLVGKGIDIGWGVEKIRPDAWGVDNCEDFSKDRSDADEFRDGVDLTGHEDGSYDWLYSCNSLEHIEDWKRALGEWVRVVKPGGVVFLYMPWATLFYPHRPEQTPGHKWVPEPQLVWDRLVELGCCIEACSTKPDRWFCFTIVARKGGHIGS